jgi:hypothetical protein
MLFQTLLGYSAIEATINVQVFKLAALKKKILLHFWFEITWSPSMTFRQMFELFKTFETV